MNESDVGRLLAAAQAGTPGAVDRLFELVYDELRAMAHARMRREGAGQTLQTTALVNEAYLRLTGSDSRVFSDRNYFFAAAAEAMRRILVDQARRRGAEKRGGGRDRIPLESQIAAAHAELPKVDLLALDDAITALEQTDEAKAEVVKLRYFVGLSIHETAELLGVSSRMIDKHWRVAKAWLRREISRGEAGAPGE